MKHLEHSRIGDHEYFYRVEFIIMFEIRKLLIAHFNDFSFSERDTILSFIDETAYNYFNARKDARKNLQKR